MPVAVPILALKVLIDTLLTGAKVVDVEALYDPDLYRARLLRVQGMPMFQY